MDTVTKLPIQRRVTPEASKYCISLIVKQKYEPHVIYCQKVTNKATIPRPSALCAITFELHIYWGYFKYIRLNLFSLLIPNTTKILM